MKQATQTQKTTKVQNTKKPLIEKTDKGLVINEQPKKEKVKKPILELAENVTGKMLMASQIEANNLFKTEYKSASKVYELFVEYAHTKTDFTKSIKGFNLDEVKPSKNLLDNFRTEKEKEKGTFSLWLYMQIVKRYYKNK